MIIADKFVWGHIPKTGGDATNLYFKLFKDKLNISFQHFQYQWFDKHKPFKTRSNEELNGKMLVLNIRRLPNWLISMEHQSIENKKNKIESMRANQNGILKQDWPSLKCRSGDELSQSTEGDNWIKAFTNNGELNIDHWLRMENLKTDLLKFINRLTDIPLALINEIEKLNTEKSLNYDKNIETWFKSSQIKELYKNNPLWAEVEKQYYSKIF